MKEFTHYQDAVLSLSPEQLSTLVGCYGGTFTDPHVLIDEVGRKEHEEILCRCFFRCFGVKVLTAAERDEQLRHREVEATARGATAAEEANRIAKEANRIAEEAKRVAELSMYWTKVAGIVAIASAAISLFSLAVSLYAAVKG